ncbi:MAG: isopeptide-forming domain-containing fimbrial protein [Ruminococcus sp.]|jgi:fimbrial isopeptide formation D2 family protein/LPXTG-motif cell wall-anchored protein
MKKRTTILCCSAALICLIFLGSLLGVAVTAWASISRPESPQTAGELWDETADPQETAGIHVIRENSGESLSGDCFGAKVIDGVTQAEPFGPWDSLDVDKTTYAPENLISLRINALDYSLRGKVGLWYRNTGTWQGRSVDLKATLADYEFYTRDGIPSHMILWGMSDRIGFCVAGESYIDIRYEYFDSETGEPLFLPCFMTFDDVDWGQAIELTGNPGELYIPEESNLRCLTDNDGSVTFISDGAWYDDNTAAAHTSSKADSFMTRFEGAEQTQRFYCCYYFREGYESDKNFLSDFSDPESLRIFCDSLDYFGYSGQPLAPSEPSTPIKEVSDSDERGQENTLSSIQETFTYSVYHTVPNEEPNNYYAGYTLTDRLAAGLTLIDASVCDESGADVTEAFTVAADGQTISFTANDTNRAGFYYNTYRFDLEVSIPPDADLTPYLNAETDGEEYVIPNQAAVSILRNGSVEKETNETLTHIPTLHKDCRLEIHKSDAFSGAALPNAEFTLFQWNKNTEEYEELEKLTYQEDTQVYLSSPLSATLQNEGKFMASETRNPDLYEGSWEEEFTLTQDGQIIRYEVSNMPVADHTITKTALVIHDGKIAGEAPSSFETPVSVSPGDIIEYHIDVTRNCTPGYLSGTLTVTDEIPENSVWERDSLKITGEITGALPESAASIQQMKEEEGTITWIVKDLDNGEGAHLTFQIEAPKEKALLTNTAWLHLPEKPDLSSNETRHQTNPTLETVTDSGKNSDTSASTKKTTVKKPSSSSAASPKTGDDSPVIIFASLSLAALALFIYLIYRRKSH